MAGYLHTVTLSPQIHKLDHDFGDTPESKLIGALVDHVADILSELLLEEKFEPDSAIAGIIAGRKEMLQTVFQKIIRDDLDRREYNNKYPGLKQAKLPVLERISTEIGHEPVPETIELAMTDKSFGLFSRALLSEKKTFDYLQTVLVHPRIKTFILPLLKQINLLRRDGGGLKQNGAQDAFHIVKSLVHDKSYTLPHSEAELFYLLTYIPTIVRYPVQELLLYKSYMDFVEESRNRLREQSPETPMHDLLLQLLEQGIFKNSHWQSLSHHEGSSDEMNIELSEINTAFMRTKQKMRDLAKTDEAHAQVVREFLQFTEAVYERIQAIHKQKGCSGLQQTDNAHCFNSSQLISTCHAVLEPPYYEIREKDGSAAAILEDDAGQMSNWQYLVREHSSFSLPGNGGNSFAVPCEDLLLLADDPQVRLYLLDIQNGTDRIAGIKVAEELIERLIANHRKRVAAKEPDLTEPKKMRKIIVWSSSPELVRLAAERLQTFIDRNGWEKDIKTRTSISSAFEKPTIELQTQLKSDHLWLY